MRKHPDNDKSTSFPVALAVVGGGYRPPLMGTLPDTEPLANAIYVAPEWVKPNMASGAFTIQDHAKDAAHKRGIILRKSPAAYNDADRGGGFYGKQGTGKNALSHELVHSIQNHRKGPVKSVLDDAKREWGAYSRTLLGKNAARKMVGGAGKIGRFARAVVGTAGSTVMNTIGVKGQRPLFAAKLKPVLIQAVVAHVEFMKVVGGGGGGSYLRLRRSLA